MSDPRSVDVAVVGAGELGAALGHALSRSDVRVGFVSSTPGFDRHPSVLGHGRQVLSMADAAITARMVVLTDSHPDVAALFADVGSIRPTATFVDVAARSRSTAQVAMLRSCVRGAAVYRVLWPEGSTGVLPIEPRRPVDGLYAGPDDEGRDCVEGLLARIGLRPVYLGGSDRIGVIESCAALRHVERIDGDLHARPVERLLAALN